MPKYAQKVVFIFTIVFLAAGCSSTNSVSVRSYMEDKPRVDQEVSGALGNWQNSPDAVYTATKDTRKVYVVEVTQDDGTIIQKQVNFDEDYQQPVVNSYEKRVQETRREVYQEPGIDIPSFDDEYDYDVDDEDFGRMDFSDDVDVDQADVTYVDYKVEKDDTLQKISKKFYDSYSKWPQIYEVNKDKIKDPNRIKPGIVIRIPQ